MASNSIADQLNSASDLDESSSDEDDIFASKFKQFNERREATARQLTEEHHRQWLAASARNETATPTDLDPDVDPEVLALLDTPEQNKDITGAREFATPPSGQRHSRRKRRRISDDGGYDNEVAPLRRKGSLTKLMSQLADANSSFNAETPPEKKRAAVPQSEAELPFTARVRAGSLIVRLQMFRCEPLSRLFEHVAAETGVAQNRVCLGQRDKVYQRDQTPDDVQLGMFDILDFWETEPAAAAPGPTAPAEPPPPEGSIELVVQSAQRRSRLTLRMMPNQPMSKLMQDYATKRQLTRSTLRFRFDGEELDPDATAESLELEDGDCIDVHEI